MNYILVHGAWHGAWVWDRVRSELETSGIKVYTPTLTGLGERVHLMSPEIGLETHVNDIVSLIEDEKICDIVLVGHSYAGIVTTVVANRIAEKIARLVYLDAVVPKSGQCHLDHVPTEYRKYIEIQVKINGEGWKIPVVNKELLGLEHEKDIDWVMPKLIPHPYRTFTDLVYLAPETYSSVPRSYLIVLVTICLGAEKCER